VVLSGLFMSSVGRACEGCIWSLGRGVCRLSGALVRGAYGLSGEVYVVCQDVLVGCVCGLSGARGGFVCGRGSACEVCAICGGACGVFVRCVERLLGLKGRGGFWCLFLGYGGKS
jgi:hypothetical protein